MQGKLIAVAYTLIIHIIVSYDKNILFIFFCKIWNPSALCLHYRPETVHCSTKDAYTSEITFLAYITLIRRSSKKVCDTKYEEKCALKPDER